MANVPDMMDQEADVADIGIGYWNKERPEIDCSGKAITGRILRLSELALGAMNANMSKFGVKYSTYAIVATLRAVGSPYRLSPTQLQNTLMITSGGVSNLLRRVESLGFIQRLIDPSDGRGVIVELTAAGLQLSEVTMPSQADLERHLVRMFTPEEKEILVRLLRRMLLLNQSLPS